MHRLSDCLLQLDPACFTGSKGRHRGVTAGPAEVPDVTVVIDTCRERRNQARAARAAGRPAAAARVLGHVTVRSTGTATLRCFVTCSALEPDPWIYIATLSVFDSAGHFVV